MATKKPVAKKPVAKKKPDAKKATSKRAANPTFIMLLRNQLMEKIPGRHTQVADW
jgi:hypothetical protein